MSSKDLNTILGKIAENADLINQHGKLESAQLKRLQNRFRLDWNYYSNRIEGGTLTIDETRSIMMGNITIAGKSIKDVMEMKGHDSTISEILKIGKGAVRLSEKRIKEIHRAIMHEDDPTLKEQIGDWKTKPNYVYNYKQEKHEFLPPAEVPEAMHRALNEINAYLDRFHDDKKKDSNPTIEISRFHIDFVSIHPFYDGNGRMARILTNLLLISCGYPPIIIKDQDKDRYTKLLADIQTNQTNENLFHQFIGERIIDSQELVIKAISGESIEQDDDIDKELELLKLEIRSKDKGEVLSRSLDSIKKLYFNSFRQLFELMLDKFTQFDDLFFEKTITARTNDIRSNDDPLIFFDSLFGKHHEHSQDFQTKAIRLLALEISYEGFRNDGVNTFGTWAYIQIEFEQYKYRVKSNHGNHTLEKLYSEPLKSNEINQLVSGIKQEVVQHIKTMLSRDK